MSKKDSKEMEAAKALMTAAPVVNTTRTSVVFDNNTLTALNTIVNLAVGNKKEMRGKLIEEAVTDLLKKYHRIERRILLMV